MAMKNSGTCIPPKDSQVTVQGMGQGRHVVHLRLRLKDEPHTVLAGTDRTFTIELRIPEEFVPTYSWSLLHAWHTIPASIETRLATILAPFLALTSAALHPFRRTLLPLLAALQPHLARILDLLRVLGDAASAVERRVAGWVAAVSAPLAPLGAPLAPYLAYVRRAVRTPSAGSGGRGRGGAGVGGKEGTGAVEGRGVDAGRDGDGDVNNADVEVEVGVGVEVTNVVYWGTVAHLVVFCVCMLCQWSGLWRAGDVSVPSFLSSSSSSDPSASTSSSSSCDAPVGLDGDDNGDVGLSVFGDDDDDNDTDDDDDVNDDDDDDDNLDHDLHNGRNGHGHGHIAHDTTHHTTTTTMTTDDVDVDVDAAE